MSAHTPAPWVYDHDTGTVETDDRLVIAYNRYQRTDEETQANGRLIASAPDLLSIVKRFVALPAGAWHPGRRAADEAGLMQDARAAIARVNGNPSHCEHPHARND